MHEQAIQNLHTLVYTVGRITPTGVSLLGTCFLLPKGGLFATAAHVTNNDDNNLVIVTSKNTSLSTYQDTSDTQVQVIPAKIEQVDPFRDICILKIDNPVAKTNLVIGGADNVSVGNELSVIGFPHCTEGRRVLTFQTTEVGAKVLIEANGIKSKHLIINIQTRPGQSGSPIFKDQTLVAMVIGSYSPKSGGQVLLGPIDPSTLHQTTHAVSSQYIIDMI